jgi:NAD(P)-dependent dehydrogenase (short-subunit alcohol dehydrogenase family)
LKVNLKGRNAGLIGVRHSIADAAMRAIAANGAEVSFHELDANMDALDIALLSHDLSPPATLSPSILIEAARRIASSMADRGAGRILHLFSALAIVPMRRHPGFSTAAASSVAAVRALAMNAAPKVLVNAIAIGAIGEPDALAAGDRAMLTHTASNRSGCVSDVANAALFFLDPANSYTTGQVLSVDGGWTVGYSRNF